jgi:hypothetical protein
MRWSNSIISDWPWLDRRKFKASDLERKTQNDSVKSIAFTDVSEVLTASIFRIVSQARNQ